MAKRRVNIVALIIILLLILSIIPGVYLFRKFQIKRNAFNEYKLAEEAIAKGEDESAYGHLRT